MLATLVDEPFDDDDWLFEIKWDGYRAICTIDESGKMNADLAQRPRSARHDFPTWKIWRTRSAACRSSSTARSSASMTKGRSAFQRLQDSGKERVALTYVAFDLLYADGRDLRKTSARRTQSAARTADRRRDPRVVFEAHRRQGDGALRTGQAQRSRRHHRQETQRRRYRSGASRDWVKIKAQHEQEFVVGGWTEPQRQPQWLRRAAAGRLRRTRSCATSVRSAPGFRAKRARRDLCALEASSSARRRHSSTRSIANAPVTLRSRSWSRRCASPSGRASGTCASRRSSACAKIRTPKTS